jgi:D-3-phosphoglycerate dehydrogenase
MTKIFLSHSPSQLARYYGPRATAALQALTEVHEVQFNPHEADIGSAELAALAQDADIIVSYRQTVG